MHSWRTLILPFLDQAGLYRAYRFDELWDGPHNSQFLDVILPVYRCPVDAKQHDKESAEARMGGSKPHRMQLSRTRRSRSRYAAPQRRVG